jgi:hypothetical protein
MCLRSRTDLEVLQPADSWTQVSGKPQISSKIVINRLLFLMRRMKEDLGSNPGSYMCIPQSGKHGRSDPHGIV